MSELIVNPVAQWVDVEQVMLDLEAETDLFPIDAIRLVQMHPQLFIPRLIETIDNAVAYVEAGVHRDGEAHVLALFLLTEFRVQEAWPAIRRVLLLPEEGSCCLFGQTAYESLDRILPVFAAGKIEILDELLSHPELDPFARIKVTEAFFYLVRDGHMTRDEAVGRLHGLLWAAIEDVDGQTATELVQELVRYAPHEALDEVRAAYRDGLIDPEQIELSEVEESLTEGEAGFEMRLGDCQPTGISDTVDEWEVWLNSQNEDEDDYEGNSDEYDDEERVIDLRYQSEFGMALSMLWREFQGIEPIDIKTLDIDEPEIEVGTIFKTERRVGRNEPCPCGSGKKYKKCCGGS